MRIAIVTNSFPETSETFILNKVLSLRESGNEVFVFAKINNQNLKSLQTRLDKPFDAIYDQFSRKDPRYFLSLLKLIFSDGALKSKIVFEKARDLYGWNKRALRAALFALPLAKGSFDVIHFEFSGIAVNFLDALPILKSAKLVVSCRGAAEKITPMLDPARSEMLKRVFQHIDKIHCVSEDMSHTVQRYGADPKKIVVIRPAIDSSLFKRSSTYPKKAQGPFKILSVGRLHWKKGYLYSIQAMADLIKEGVDIVYEIIGEGAERDSLEFMIHELNLERRVILKGNKDAVQVRASLEEADIFLLPSLSEGLSNAVLEALAMEVPVISTRVDGMPEAIEDGVSGYLVPSRNSRAIGEKIKILIVDQHFREQAGLIARKRIETDFDIKNQTKMILNLYLAQ